MSTSLFRKPTAVEVELLRARDELARVRRELREREEELAELRAHLLSFEGRYIRQVGILYKKLDEWERKRAELHGSSQDAAGDDGDSTAAAATSDADVASATAGPTQASLDLRALFRELAKRIHPDRARDAQDEQHRTRLMAQANDALQRKDRRALERMLNGFEAPAGNALENTEAELAEVREQTVLVREDLAHAAAEHHSLAHSELAGLEAQVMAAAREGRDLLAETAARVQGRIGLAMRAYELDLDRIRRPGRGMSVDELVSAETPAAPVLRYDPKLRRWVRPHPTETR